MAGGRGLGHERRDKDTTKPGLSLACQAIRRCHHGKREHAHTPVGAKASALIVRIAGRCDALGATARAA